MGKTSLNEPDHNKLDQQSLIGRRSASGTLNPQTPPTTPTIPMTNSAPALPFQSEASLRRYAEWMSILDGYESASSEALLETLRNIRNKVIGHAEVKNFLVQQDFIPRLVRILQVQSHDKASLMCKRECTVMIGSIVADGRLSDEVVPLLMDLIVSASSSSSLDESKALVESSLRALRTAFRHSESSRDIPFQDHFFGSLLELLRGTIHGSSLSDQNVSQYICSILANCCDSPGKQQALLKSNIMELVGPLLESAHQKQLEVGLDLLASLVRENRPVASAVVQYRLPCGVDLLPLLFELAGKHARPDVRLMASVVVTNLFRSKAIPHGHDLVIKDILPGLTQLCDEAGLVRVRAPLIMAFLVSQDEALQLACIGCNAVGKLLSMVEAHQREAEKGSEYKSSAGPDKLSLSEQACESAMIALASVSSSREECRKLILESGVLRAIVRFLSGDSRALRSSACQCVRSLSRSAKTLRTTLVDAHIVEPIIGLLDPSEDTVVRTAACATLCNLVLDFSPMKQACIEKGALELIVDMARSIDPSLRLNAVWALKNTLYLAEPRLKDTVMATMGYGLLYELTGDSEVEVQVQALNMIRNLACGEDHDILQVLQGIGTTKLLGMVLEKLASDRKDLVIQALYVLVNVATGGCTPKGAIMSNAALLSKIQSFIRDSSDEDIRLGAIWCVINLTWPDDEGAEKRVEALRSLGFQDSLRKVITLQHLSIDLNDRAQIALEHFTVNFH